MHNILTNKDAIKAWLDKYQIEKYTINEDMTVDVDGDVLLGRKGLKSIDVQFNHVHGKFWCHDNELTSLLGCPHIVEEGFLCDSNQLTSLEYCPEIVKGLFCCSDNKITSLKYSPKQEKGYFDCSFNQLTSLEGCPNIINGEFICNDNQLTSLIHGPSIVHGHYECNNNQITFLNIAPKVVDGSFYCHNNPIEHVNDFSCIFTKDFLHGGNINIIEQLSYYYEENKNGDVVLKLSYDNLAKALLYDKLNDELVIENKTISKKIKI